LFLFLLVIFLNMKRPSFNGSHVPFVILLILGLFDHYSMTLQQGQLLFILLYALRFRSGK
jgi:hypothetical protein